MKKNGKCKTGRMLAVLALAVLLALPQTIFAASQMDLTVGTTTEASAGDMVTVRLVVSNNPGITTFATKLTYDSDVLEYVSTEWAETISSNTANIAMVTSTTENSEDVLNISAIMNTTYSNNETIATLTFRAKEAYSTTMPVTLAVREITDESYDAVIVSTVVDPTAGETETETESESESESESQSTSQSSSETESESESESESQTTSSSQSSTSNTSSSSQSSSEKTTSSSQSGSTKTDQTPKTGAVSYTMVFGIAAVVFLGLAAGCFALLGKKKKS